MAMDSCIKMMLLALVSALCCVHSGYFAYPYVPDGSNQHYDHPTSGHDRDHTPEQHHNHPDHHNHHNHPDHHDHFELKQLTIPPPGYDNLTIVCYFEGDTCFIEETASTQTSSGNVARKEFPNSTEQDGGEESSTMEVLYSWKQVDFDFPNGTREKMISNKLFIPLNNLILDVDVYEEGSERRVFVTLPRVRPGVPVTLAMVSHKRRGGANLLAPFPDWASNTPGLCKDSVITSVFRTHVDTCGRLWVLDSGNNDAFAGPTSRIVCPPKVMIYDLHNNNRLIGSHIIPNSMIASNTLLVTIIVDVRGSDCRNAHAYIADSMAYKMIVFNLGTGKFWRLHSILFQPYPDQSIFTINGLSFDLSGGVFGLALSPVYGQQRVLYFHCIDSVRQSWVNSTNLQNMTLWESNMSAKPRAFQLYNGTRSSQSAAAATTYDGIMFFGVIGSNEIACWDTRRPFGQENIVSLAKDDNTLQFNSGIKVYNDKVYAVTNRLQNYYNRRVPVEEVNYRILVGDVKQMTRGTKCEVNHDNRIDDSYTPNLEGVDYDDIQFIQ